MPKVQLPSQITYPCKILELCVGYGQKLKAGEKAYIVEDAVGRTGAIKTPADGYVTQMPYPPGSVFSKPMVVLTVGDVPPPDLNAEQVPPKQRNRNFEKQPTYRTQSPNQEQPDRSQKTASDQSKVAPKQGEDWSLAKALSIAIILAAVVPGLIGLALVYLPIFEGRNALMYPMALVAIVFGAWAGIASSVHRQAHEIQAIALFVASLFMAVPVSGFFALADSSADARHSIAEAFGVNNEDRLDKVVQQTPDTTRPTHQTGANSSTQTSTSSQQSRSGVQTSQKDDNFIFYFVQRRSTKTYDKSDCPLPYGIKEYVTPIECTVVDTRDLFVVSQHLCFVDSKTGGSTPIRYDEYLALSKLKTTSRSTARDLRDKIKRWPEQFFEGPQAGMIDTYYDAIHEKKNQYIPIMEFIGDTRRFQRSWDDLEELRKALRGVGC